MSSLVQIQRFNQGLVALRMGFEESSPAFDEQLLATLAAAFASVAADSDVSAIVVCGSAGRFLSGADVAFFLECLRRGQLDRVLQFTRQAQRLLIDISRCPKPVTAWIEGPAIGGGLELALACHRIVAGPKAKFSLPETGLGILPGMGGTQRLPRRVGLGLAKWMIYTGAILPADHALQLGLVDALADAQDLSLGIPQPQPRPPLDAKFATLADLFSRQDVRTLLDTSLGLPADPPTARALVQMRSAAPLALRLAEVAIEQGIALPLEAGLEVEFDQVAQVLQTADALAGLGAIGQPRPRFSGC